MNRYVVTIFVVLAAAGAAFASGLYTAANTAAHVVIPARAGLPVITAMNIVGGAATADLLIYEGDSTVVTSTDIKAAADTAFRVSTCTGIDNNDLIVIQGKATGTPLEVAYVAACIDTTNVLAITAATASAFSGTKGYSIYEMKLKTTFADVGTTRVSYAGDLISCENDKPVAMTFNGSGGTFHWVSADWR